MSHPSPLVVVVHQKLPALLLGHKVWVEVQRCKLAGCRERNFPQQPLGHQHTEEQHMELAPLVVFLVGRLCFVVSFQWMP